MSRPTVARIDLEAIRHNYRLAASMAGQAGAMAVIKADGYGHGIGPVAEALGGEARRFAVACIEEAQRIREQGLAQPVVLLQGVHQADDLGVCASQGFEPVIHSPGQLAWMKAAPVPAYWLKVNTGMNRLGFRPAELADVVEQLSCTGCRERLLGFVTHFACADDTGHPMTAEQTCVFEQATAPWPHLMRSVGNSAAHFRPGQPLFDWSRPGIMLFGGSPLKGKTGPELGLKPAMTLQAPLIATRTLQPGESVGYGASWTAERETPMGMVAIGYGDGYPRHAGTGTPAAINGQRVRLLGRVSMDMLAVDLSQAPDAREGDIVELWGPTVSVDEVANHAGTIGYELLTGVTARVPRIYQ
jgi:alanine racemase